MASKIEIPPPKEPTWLEKFLMKYAHRILIFGLIAIFISPWLFTISLPFEWIDFSNTGEIGDTIGGITAPIVNLIAAFLVYISFKAQIQANDIQVFATTTQRQDFEAEKERIAKRDNFNTLLTLIKENQDDFLEKGNSPELSVFQQDFMARTRDYISARINDDTYGKLNSGPPFENLFTRKEIFSEYHMLFRILRVIIIRIDAYELNDNDRKLLVEMSKIFYEAHLKDVVDGILATYSEIRSYDYKIEGIPMDKYIFFSTLIEIRNFYEKGEKIVMGEP